VMVQKSMAALNANGSDNHCKMTAQDYFATYSQGNCTNTTLSTVAESSEEVDMDDIARCGRMLAGTDPLAALSATGSRNNRVDNDVDGDEELQKAIALSLEPQKKPPCASKAAALPARSSRPQTPPDPVRARLTERLFKTGYLEPSDPRFAHGRAYDGPMLAPTKIWESQEPPRKDHSAPEWLTASEFEDQQEVAQAKVRQLAELMRLSKRTVLYTGAGISASVIGQAALSGQNTVGWKVNAREAKPTFTHHALGLLGQEGLIHSWVQQNHDGLPQKAGFPQECINEVHGSWYDPSNPVVKYNGSLHSRAGPWMKQDADTADLVIVLGSSLSGLNADQVVTSTAERSMVMPPPPAGVLAPGAQIRGHPPGYQAMCSGTVLAVLDEGDLLVQFDFFPDPVMLPASAPIELQPPQKPSLGVACINLQQTTRDGEMSLRLNGKSDALLRALLRELGLNPSQAKTPSFPKVSAVLVPYDKDGRRQVDPSATRMWLDLSDKQAVRITPGHNIQGAKQPMYLHIGASEPVTYLGREREPGIGLGTVFKREEESSSFIIHIEGEVMRLGIWWLEAAVRGAVDVLPIVNVNPIFEGDAAPDCDAPAAKAFSRRPSLCAAGGKAAKVSSKASARPKIRRSASACEDDKASPSDVPRKRASTPP